MYPALKSPHGVRQGNEQGFVSPTMTDGMYLVGLDIVGDELMEINVFSPGGLGVAQKVTGVDFSRTVIADLSRKVELRDHYAGKLDNTVLASL